ncbi:MAG: TlpA family protein disulfide reductase [Chloroflexi bacterium]|nr:TlpA family protein disulfide reductase [Chloroflexota bacterium]
MTDATPGLLPDSSPTPSDPRLVRASRIRRIVIVNSAFVVIALGLFLATRPLGGGAARPTVDPAASFYVLGSELGGLDVGKPAPDFVGRPSGQSVRLTDLDGQPVVLAELRGRPVWVVFWATWCPPCQRETPDLRATYEAHKQDGLVLVAIDIQEPADVVEQYVRKFGLTYRIGLDETGAISEAYGVFGLPTHYFIDRQGVIRDRNFGPLTRAQMEQRVAALLGR